MPSQTTAAGVSTAALIAILPFIGPAPVEWPRALVFIAVAVGVALLGVFAADKRQPPPQGGTPA